MEEDRKKVGLRREILRLGPPDHWYEMGRLQTGSLRRGYHKDHVQMGW